MTLTIQLSERVERILADRAARTGQTVEAVARESIERDLGEGPTFDEILAPFRKEVAESGMSEGELDAFFQEIRQEVWDEQHPPKS